ncbi:MAG: DUF3426 domain-containing protein [Desulfobacterales bacterium]|jgi:predicted Zn finger-like uncharacterized protein|nr:DUF3426 domain-containing protein [Desulfobacterales bacterium]
MIVSCQNCNARFNLEDGLVKESGSKVRCSKCKHIFLVYPEKTLDTDPVFPDMPVQEEIDSKPLAVVEPENAASDFAPSLGEELDLSEIEKMLETAAGDKAPDALSAGADTIGFQKDTSPAEQMTTMGEGALDLSEIEKILEMEQDSSDDLEIEPEPDELIFDLDDSEDGQKPKNGLGDFDLADIEKMLAQEADETEAAPADNLDLSDLDRMMETTSSPVETLKAGDEQEAFKLESADSDELLPAAESAEALAPAVDELDFSGLEAMMAEEASALKEDLQLDEETGELSLSLGDDAADGMSQAAVASEALDLSELDGLMAAKPNGPVTDTDIADEELSLEMEQPASKVAAVAAAVPGEPELVFEEEGEDVGTAQMPANDDLPMETEDLNLEFDEDQLDNAVVAEEEKAEDDTAEAAPVAATDALAAAQKPIVAKKRSNKPFMIILMLILLAGAAGLGFFYLSGKDIKIPFLSDLQKAAPADPGNLRIATTDVDSRFIEQSQIGRLFVITGKVRNDYSDARSFIRITGRLFTIGKKPANTETVFCGNMMSDLEISTASLETIKNRLGNRTGDSNVNVNIKPGEDRPFMIVFSNLPEKLEEFTLEVAGSQSAVPITQK